ncbi:hypothetical protein T08_14417 [Trichinella sp. T8]|nr:hypothetical protein T08_14417 [Trichinella sp. T8]
MLLYKGFFATEKQSNHSTSRVSVGTESVAQTSEKEYGNSWIERIVTVIASREAGRKGSIAAASHVEMTVRGNLPVDTESSSLSDEYANSAIVMVNEPFRESGLLSTLKGGNVKYVREPDLNRVALTSDTIRSYIDCRHSLLNTNNSEQGIIRQEINEYHTEKANTLKAIFQQRQNHKEWRSLLVFVDEYSTFDMLFRCENNTGKARTTEKSQDAGSSQTDSMSTQTNPPVRKDATSHRKDHDSFSVGAMNETALDLIRPL